MYEFMISKNSGSKTLDNTSTLLSAVLKALKVNKITNIGLLILEINAIYHHMKGQKNSQTLNNLCKINFG